MFLTLLSVIGTVASVAGIWLTVHLSRQLKKRSFRQLWNDLLKLKVQMDREGFRPDLIIGVPLGGLIVADLLHIRFFPDVPVMGIPLLRLRENRALQVSVVPNLTLEQLQGMRILVVDDTARSGRTMKVVTDYLRAAGARDDHLYTAVVGKLAGVTGYAVDFYALEYGRELRFPWGKVPEDDYGNARSSRKEQPLPPAVSSSPALPPGQAEPEGETPDPDA